VRFLQILWVCICGLSKTFLKSIWVYLTCCWLCELSCWWFVLRRQYCEAKTDYNLFMLFPFQFFGFNSFQTCGLNMESSSSSESDPENFTDNERDNRTEDESDDEQKPKPKAKCSCDACQTMKDFRCHACDRCEAKSPCILTACASSKPAEWAKEQREQMDLVRNLQGLHAFFHPKKPLRTVNRLDKQHWVSVYTFTFIL